MYVDDQSRRLWIKLRHRQAIFVSGAEVWSGGQHHGLVEVCIYGCGLTDQIVCMLTCCRERHRMKEVSAMRRHDGAKQRTVTIPKLDDANHAGGPKGKDCTLILTEGDSAKALAVSGLGIVGRDTFGVFPLRGKLLNVREASQKQVCSALMILHDLGSR
jgi:hypothetical protein